MTKIKVLIASVAAVVGAMLAFSLVPASSQQPPAPTQFELVEFTDKAKEIFLDLNKKNEFGPGDMVVTSSPMFDAENTGERVGKFAVNVSFSPPRRCECFTFNGAVKLADGKLSISGLGEFRSFETGFEIPIVGGTGIYSRASGSATLIEERIDGKNATRWSFEVFMN
ncbi:MAG: hypothetical protein ACRDJJ_04915 [Actinomycetota bacterium]